MKALFADMDNSFVNTTHNTTPAKTTTRHDAISVKNTSYDAFSPPEDKAEMAIAAEPLPGNLTCSEQRSTSIEAKDVDMNALCDGAEDWDWKNMDMDEEFKPSGVCKCFNVCYVTEFMHLCRVLLTVSPLRRLLFARHALAAKFFRLTS